MSTWSWGHVLDMAVVCTAELLECLRRLRRTTNAVVQPSVDDVENVSHVSQGRPEHQEIVRLLGQSREDRELFDDPEDTGDSFPADDDTDADDDDVPQVS